MDKSKWIFLTLGLIVGSLIAAVSLKLIYRDKLLVKSDYQLSQIDKTGFMEEQFNGVDLVVDKLKKDGFESKVTLSAGAKRGFDKSDKLSVKYDDKTRFYIKESKTAEDAIDLELDKKLAELKGELEKSGLRDRKKWQETYDQIKAINQEVNMKKAKMIDQLSEQLLASNDQSERQGLSLSMKALSSDYKYTVAAFADLKVGDKVKIFAAQDIKSSDEVVAQRVEIIR